MDPKTDQTSETAASSDTQEQPTPRFTKEKLISGLKNGEFKKITVMTGAGISVAAGIPDFRSPDTGLYAKLEEYKLPYPEAIFNIEYFRTTPEPFYRLAQDFLDLQKYKATYVHHFCKMLKDKGVLGQYLTQNIDNLEVQTGFTQDDIIQAHGANFGAKCSKCGEDQDRQQLEQFVSQAKVMRCKKENCDGPIKPDIVFFGEQLPQKFTKALIKLAGNTDLLIVIGTSLKVSPFNQIVNVVSPYTPKVLINLEDTATAGFDFEDAEKHPERLFLKGKSQDTIKEIARELGWLEELEDRKKKADEKHDRDNLEKVTEQISGLTVDNEKKEEEKESQNEGDQIDSSQKQSKKDQEEPEFGPLMGFFAVEPIKECPHCIPDEFITPVEEFKDITIKTPCYSCGHDKENWICLKCKIIGCSRYVNNHMLEHHDKEQHPLVLSFADFSYWCYACESYVVSKHLKHVDHFYPQKFGAQRASHMQEYAGIMASKAAKKDKQE